MACVLPEELYTAAQVRELDRLAIEECGIPALTLMERAGRRCPVELVTCDGACVACGTVYGRPGTGT